MAEAEMKKVEKHLVKGNRAHVVDCAKHNCQTGGSEEAKDHAVILTCMDARIDPLKFGNFGYDKVYVVRNAGGRASDDMIRSMVITIREFAVDHIFVVHHTKCGMCGTSDAELREKLHQSLGPGHLEDDVKHDKGNRDKYRQADYVAFLPFKDLEESVIDDVAKLHDNPLISKKVEISGYIYNVDTGKLERVDKACK